MDPNNLQNTLNGLGSGTHTNFTAGMQGNQQFGHNLMNTAGQYNPMLLQQQYLNFGGFNMNYGNNSQMLDFQAQQQQQYLVQQMQQHHQQQQHNIQPIFQQHNSQQQILQQQLQLMQQHHQQQQQQQQQPLHPMQNTQLEQTARLFQQPDLVQQPQIQQIQQIPQVQQVQQPLHQTAHQKLFEEQCRQIEQEKKKQMEVQRQLEIAEQARLREQHEQQERQRQELLRKQEEEARLAEEQRRKEELERIEREKLLRFAEEEKRKLAESQKVRSGMEGRHSQIGQPITLVATHFLPNFLNMIPFPYEGMSHSNLPKVSDTAEDGDLLNVCDEQTVSTICNLLAQVDVDDITSRVDKLCPSDKENNDLFFDQLPPLIKAVVSFNNSALDVDSHNNMELLDNEDLMMQEQVLIQPSSSFTRVAPTHVPEPVVQQPSHQNHHSTSSPSNEDEEEEESEESGTVSIEKRRQMMSVGKCPKAGGGNQRKKRDMVESLYDSLTDNFVPSVGRRGRRRNRGVSEDDDDETLKRDLALINAMESGQKLPSSITGFPTNDDGGRSEDEDDEHRFFDKKGRKRRKEENYDRPPTPTEVISARDAEWAERQRQKQEMHKKRKVGDDAQEAWNTDALAENDSFIRFNTVLDTIFEQVENIDFSTITGSRKHKHSHNTSKDSGGDSDEEEEDEVNPDLLIDRTTMDELRREASKLKMWQKLHKVSAERLVKIVSMLERNIRDVISADNMRLLVPILDDELEEGELALKEVVEERLIKAVDAACAALTIMTSHKMHKQVLLEDTIERAVALSKLYLTHVIYPASDILYRTTTGKKKGNADEPKKKRRAGAAHKRSENIGLVFRRVVDLFGCFAELVRLDSIPESAIHHMASMSVSAFFVANVGELQMQSMKLASNIFSRGDEQVRYSMVNDILSSLHKVPSTTIKNVNNGYRLGNDLWISNTTALVMQLMQSTIKMPKLKKHEDDNEESAKRQVNQDAVVKDSFSNAARFINAFLTGFLSKCSQKGNKLDGEEDYKNLFSHFLQDLLMSLYQPEWPVSEMILTTLGSLLVKNFRSKSTEISIRQASLDYLGLITARLRKDVKAVVDDSASRLELVVKTLIFEEDNENRYDYVDDVDISKLSNTDKLKKLEQALIDYIIERKGDSDVSVEYSVLFYAGEWYKEVAEDVDIARSEHKQGQSRSDLTEKEQRKLEKKLDRMVEKGTMMKEFLMKLVDRKSMRKRAEMIRNRGNVLMESDALWAVKYLAQNREFSHSFDTYLKHIVFGAGSETVVNLRTRALKCLTMIIEADHEVLIMDEVQKAVHSRMMDSHAQVREASIELLGKFVLVKEEFVRQYYNMLAERILDSGIAVRKRVIRIMREVCERYPRFDKIPEMLSRMIRRVNDEEGVKKLVHDTFSTLWFHPIDEKAQPNMITTKVMVMSSVVQYCIADSTVDYLEQLIHTVLKTSDKSVLYASKQIVDNLVDSILHLETKMATDNSGNSEQTNELDMAAKLKNNQDRLLACLTTLAIFSKVRPELMVRHAETLQPYLTSTTSHVRTPAENAVMNEVIGMLERVVPLMSHPSDNFLTGIDDDLTKMATQSGMQLVVSATACCSAIYNRFKKGKPKLADKFMSIYGYLDNIKKSFDRDPNCELGEKQMAGLNRAVFTVGVLCRYFDFDEIISIESNKKANPENGDAEVKPSTVIRDRVFSVLEFFSRSTSPMIKQKALTSIGHFCAQWSEYLTRSELQQMYLAILGNKIAMSARERLPLKIQVLKNLEMFLQTEEKKLIKGNEDWEANKERENLKEMELSGSGLGSTVIQIYWNAVLNSYFDADMNQRVAAVQVTWLTLSQGLVTPGSSIATLIAMTTDPNDNIRNRVENLLKEIDSKYSGMVQSKAILGVRVAYKLHQKIRHSMPNDPNELNLVRGIRFCDFSATSSSQLSGRTSFALPKMSNDGMALLSGLYQSLRTNRQQRRSFLQAILKLFADDSREKLKLEEWIFVADNIAMFPYQMMDEPLYVIRLIDQIVAQSGQSIIMQFKQNLRPLPAYEQTDDEDVIFDPANLYPRFPDNKDNLYELMVNSQSCFILLYIRNFLLKLYGFTEAKVQEYLPSEAAKVYEKAVSRKNVHTFSPTTALEELNPQTVSERNTMKGDFELAQKISRFRKMLLSLDRGEDNEDDDESKFVPASNEDDYEDDEEEMDTEAAPADE